MGSGYDENSKRRAQKENAEGKSAFSVSSEQIQDIKNLLKLCGISYIEAPLNIEAEHLAAYLTTKYDKYNNTFDVGLYDFVLSGDSDVLLFGGNLLMPIKKSSKKAYIRYNINDILNKTELSFADWQWVCIALGSDFSKKVPNIGEKTVLSKIKAKKITFDDIHKDVFKYINTKISPNDLKIVSNKFDKDNLIKFLTGFSFNIDKLSKRLHLL